MNVGPRINEGSIKWYTEWKSILKNNEITMSDGTMVKTDSLYACSSVLDNSTKITFLKRILKNKDGFIKVYEGKKYYGRIGIDDGTSSGKFMLDFTKSDMPDGFKLIRGYDELWGDADIEISSISSSEKRFLKSKEVKNLTANK